MITAWFKHAKTEEEKTKLEQSLKHSRWVLDLQSEILDDLEKNIDRSETTPSIYDKPNWDYRQADAIGYRRCLKHVKTLINLDLKEPQ